MRALNKHISEFLDRVCGEIKYKKIHDPISIELEGHIYDLMDGYIEDGMNRDEAAQKAVEQMGDPIQIGKELSKTHKPKTEWSIIVLISAMVLIGGITLFSIAADNSWSFYSNHIFFLKRYVIYTLIGIGVGTTCYFFDYTSLEKYSLYIFMGTIVFLFASAKFGHEVYGAIRIRIAGDSVAPTSIAMPFFLISFAGLVNRWAKGSIKDMLKLLGLAFVAVVACYSEPSLTTALLLMAGFAIIIAMAIMNKKFRGNRTGFFLGIYGGGILSLLLLVVNIAGSTYKKARLLIFLNPESNPDGA